LSGQAALIQKDEKIERLEKQVAELQVGWQKLDESVAKKSEDYLPPNHNF